MHACTKLYQRLPPAAYAAQVYGSSFKHWAATSSRSVMLCFVCSLQLSFKWWWWWLPMHASLAWRLKAREHFDASESTQATVV
jgi:hypothetical protein